MNYNIKDSKAYNRIKYYLDELCKIKTTDVEKILLYVQLESYCDCLLDLGFISRETYDKILSINYREVLKHDSWNIIKNVTAGHWPNG